MQAVLNLPNCETRTKLAQRWQKQHFQRSAEALRVCVDYLSIAASSIYSTGKNHKQRDLAISVAMEFYFF